MSATAEEVIFNDGTLAAIVSVIVRRGGGVEEQVRRYNSFDYAKSVLEEGVLRLITDKNFTYVDRYDIDTDKDV